jgi:hypothetical protein
LIEQKIKVVLAQYPAKKLFITQGYICRNAKGEVDNLKRGGSDYTASLIAAAVQASVERTKEPATFPATVKTEILRPHATARAITKRTLGPGAIMMMIAATRYSGRRVGMTPANMRQR